MASAATAFRLSQQHEYALIHARARVFMRDPAVRPALDALVARGSSDWVRREAQELLIFLGNVESNRSPMRVGRGQRGAGRHRRRLDGAGAPGKVDPGVPRRRRRRGARGRDVRGRRVPPRRRDLQGPPAVDVLRVNAKAFDQVEFFSYRSEPPGQVACGARPKPERVYLTYRSTGGTPGTDGVAVAIELLPDDYQP